MNPRHGLLVILMSIGGPVLADADVAGNDLDRFARAQAREMSGAREAVARDDGGRVKWAGVWMDQERACPNGRLGEEGRRMVAEGGRFADDHGARQILFTPRAEAPALERDAHLAAAKAEVRPNDLIGKRCYLVIQR